jgi:hypothetical protein
MPRAVIVADVGTIPVFAKILVVLYSEKPRGRKI